MLGFDPVVPPRNTRLDPGRTDPIRRPVVEGACVRQERRSQSGRRRARGEAVAGRVGTSPYPRRTPPTHAPGAGTGERAYDFRPRGGIIVVRLTRYPWILDASSGFGARLAGGT